MPYCGRDEERCGSNSDSKVAMPYKRRFHRGTAMLKFEFDIAFPNSENSIQRG